MSCSTHRVHEVNIIYIIGWMVLGWFMLVHVVLGGIGVKRAAQAGSLNGVSSVREGKLGSHGRNGFADGRQLLMYSDVPVRSICCVGQCSITLSLTSTYVACCVPPLVLEVSTEQVLSRNRAHSNLGVDSGPFLVRHLGLLFSHSLNVNMRLCLASVVPVWRSSRPSGHPRHRPPSTTNLRQVTGDRCSGGRRFKELWFVTYGLPKILTLW